MVFYFLMVLFTMIITISLAILNAINGSISLTYAIVAPFLVNFYCLIILGILALTLRVCLPFDKVYNHERKIFKVEKREILFYEKLKIKAWKDKIPEMGHTAGFSKKSIASTEVAYLKKFLSETCFAEVLHGLAAILPLSALFFFPFRDYYFVVPILLVNLFLNSLSYLIQRYNRYRLKIVYDYKTRHLSSAPIKEENAEVEVDETDEEPIPISVE